MEARKHIGLVRQKTYFSILQLLNSILSDRKYPDMIISELFKKQDFSSYEKAAVVNLVYGILRNLGRIDHIIENGSNAILSDLPLNIQNILRICAFQVVFLDASPAGAINNALALSGREGKFYNFVKRTTEMIIGNKDRIIFPDKEKMTVEYISICHSHPMWIVKKWMKEFHEACEVEALCCANNNEPPLMIRVNPLKMNRESLQSMLIKEGFPSSWTSYSPFGLVVENKESIFKTEAFKKGAFEVQDEGSQLITMLTDVKPGEIVIDACAGNGGKSLFISGLMRSRGTVISMDTNTAKLGNLRRRAARSGALNIKTIGADEAMQYAGMADCVFIDAPCSGMGVFRRNPDSKWRLKPDDIRELSEKQKQIMSDYCVLVKPGGRLVYATCTISREENEDVVGFFLENNRDFYKASASKTDSFIFAGFATREGFFRSMPHIHGTDGFFGAVMIRRK